MLLLPINIVSVGETELDYKIELERRDGSRISILIPKEKDEKFEAEGDVYGLNFVTTGHYM